MNFVKTLSTTAAVASVSLFAQASYAQTLVFGGTGSSALFNTLARAAKNAGYVNTYTLNSGVVVNDVNDTRPLASKQGGRLFVAWTNDTTPKVIYYQSTDSTIGVRSYQNSANLALANGTSTFPAAVSPRGSVAIDFFNSNADPDKNLPTGIQSLVLASTLNAGGTDITPADAKVTTRIALNQSYSIANPIRSSYNTTNAVVFDFNVNSRTFNLFNVGASPVLVFVNRTGALGDAAVNNVNRATLAGIYSGAFGLVSDLDPRATAPAGDLVVNMREHLSGTYVTFENCIPASPLFSNGAVSPRFSTPTAVVGGTQENGITANPPQTTSNRRRRVIGSGQMESVVNNATTITADDIDPITAGIQNNLNQVGYNFWSQSRFQPLTNTKYLTVDGVDPLFDVYSSGQNYTTTPTFKNIKNGSYPIWGFLRLLLPAAPTGDLLAFVNAISPDDIVPDNDPDLVVFRSYRATADFSFPSNGIVTPDAVGADSGGAVFTINNELNYTASAGLELVNFRQ